jgi:hypothetical protein
MPTMRSISATSAARVRAPEIRVASDTPAAGPATDTVDMTPAMAIELVAAIIAVVRDEPMVRILTGGPMGRRLPAARYQPDAHGSLEEGLREAVLRDTSLDLGYVEQLQTVAMCPALNGAAPGVFAATAKADQRPNTLSIGYLALAHGQGPETETTAQWLSWYTFLPWEDWRRGKPAVLTAVIEPKLQAWAAADAALPTDAASLGRADRVRMAFGVDGAGWDEERVLERYDVLHGAGLLPEARSDAGAANGQNGQNGQTDVGLGIALYGHHRRSLALAISRLRTKIKSRPVVFELMPERFTLYEFQRTVEAILGPHLHKQNFRRLVEHMGLVEPTEEIKNHTGGRPAKLFRFRQSVLWERIHPGVRVRGARV